MLQKSVAEKTKQKHILQKREGTEKNLRFLPAVFLKKNKKNQKGFKLSGSFISGSLISGS